MRKLFSVRYKPGIEKKTLRITLPVPLRRRLNTVLDRLDSSIEDPWGITHYPKHESAYQWLCDCLGMDSVPVYDKEDNRVQAEGLTDVIARGWPPHVLDGLEAFFDITDETERSAYCASLNEVFEVSDSTLRMLDGFVIKVDSTWLQKEVLSPAISMLKEAGFEGPLDEFRKALDALHRGEWKEAMILANHSVESTQKAVLGIQSEKPGKLLRALIDSRMIPEYCTGFLEAFESLSYSVSSIRNECLGVGHGQGAEVTKVPPSVAELMVNLSGCLILFLLKHHLRRHGAGGEQ